VRISIRCFYMLVMLVVLVSGQAAAATEGKSLGKALLLSLALPGAGEQYLGNHARARAMYVAEAGVWTAFAYFRVQGANRRDRYEEMAELFAGVEGTKDDDYYKALAYYISSDDYNIDVMRDARFRYPYDRDRQLEYFEANGVFGEDTWEWQSLASQSEFRDTRTASKESYRKAVLTTGFAVLNRLVSMVDIYLSFKLDDSRDRVSRPQLRLDRNRDDGFRLYLSTPF
jgi:hypothetical protein